MQMIISLKMEGCSPSCMHHYWQESTSNGTQRTLRKMTVHGWEKWKSRTWDKYVREGRFRYPMQKQNQIEDSWRLLEEKIWKCDNWNPWFLKDIRTPLFFQLLMKMRHKGRNQFWHRRLMEILCHSCSLRWKRLYYNTQADIKREV